ncbi:MAG: hypothetical protein CMJ78_02970 [Planctomycetaceae bacterium]|nr:hypothetical protein [Planctomycetaceae bacterium]
MLRPFTCIFLLSIAVGCQSEPPTPTTITVTKEELRFDPKTVKPSKATLGWGLGSGTVEVLGREAGSCLFEYTDEIEGGYSVYKVSVPVDSGPVWVRYENSIDYGTYTESGLLTSFSLEKARKVRTGNLHEGLEQPVK